MGPTSLLSPVPYQHGQAASPAEPAYICFGYGKKKQTVGVSASQWPQTYPTCVNLSKYSIGMSVSVQRALVKRSLLLCDELLGRFPLNCSSPFCSLLAAYQLTLLCLSHLVPCTGTGTSVPCHGAWLWHILGCKLWCQLLAGGGASVVQHLLLHPAVNLREEFCLLDHCWMLNYSLTPVVIFWKTNMAELKLPTQSFL